MEKITAYKEAGEIGFTKGHISKENAEDLFQTEVTEGDLGRMLDETTDYWKTKVEKLLRDRPFSK